MKRAKYLSAAVAGLALAAGAVATASAAETEVQCARNNALRRIEVVLRPNPDLVCEVRYAKLDQGMGPRVLWIAKRNRTFCHERADRLIAALARRGWVCDVIPKQTAHAKSRPVLVVPRPSR